MSKMYRKMRRKFERSDKSVNFRSLLIASTDNCTLERMSNRYSSLHTMQVVIEIAVVMRVGDLKTSND
jgi:hypothetical protein